MLVSLLSRLIEATMVHRASNLLSEFSSVVNEAQDVHGARWLVFGSDAVARILAGLALGHTEPEVVHQAAIAVGMLVVNGDSKAPHPPAAALTSLGQHLLIGIVIGA